MTRQLLLLSGFHRSGTSLLAQVLHGNGAFFGNNLMGAGPGNPAGHFEDKSLVNLHDTFFNARGVDWRYCAEQPIMLSEAEQQRLAALAERKRAEGELVAIKDPRAMCFLSYWGKQENTRLIIIYRHWLSSVSSLLKRHAEELLFSTAAGSSLTFHTDFWRLPGFALQMWNQAAKQLLIQLRDAPESVFFFSHDSLINNNSQLCDIATQRGLPGDKFALNNFKSSLMHNSVSSSLLDMLPDTLVKESKELLDELDGQANISQITPSPDIFSPAPGYRQVAKFETPSPSLPANTYFSPPVKNYWHTIEAKKLPAHVASLPDNAPFTEILNTVAERDDIGEMVLMDLAKFCMKAKKNQLAEVLLRRSLEIREGPWKWVLLGDIYLQRGSTLARHYYERGCELLGEQPPAVLSKLVDVALTNKNGQRAEQLISLMTAQNANEKLLLNCSQKLKWFYERQKPDNNTMFLQRPEAYQETTDTNMSSPDIVTDQLKSAFLLRDNASWLEELMQEMSSPSRHCFADYLLTRLGSLWPQIALMNNLTAGHYTQQLDWKLSSPATPDARLAIWLHVFYPELIGEITAFLDMLDMPFALYVTCPHKVAPELEALSKQYRFTLIRCVNKGRDIGPWLLHAGMLENRHDIILKLHTKHSPHQTELKNWRLHLLNSLVGSAATVQDTLAMFHQNESLGIVMPPYLPALKDSITWGHNRKRAEQISYQLGMQLPETIPQFPAGSMYYYRPQALASLFALNWHEDDFEEEQAQIDGTLAHAVERLISPVCEHNKFTTELTP